jgi:hypothetical protein
MALNHSTHFLGRNIYCTFFNKKNDDDILSPRVLSGGLTGICQPEWISTMYVRTYWYEIILSCGFACKICLVLFSKCVILMNWIAYDDSFRKFVYDSWEKAMEQHLDKISVFIKSVWRGNSHYTILFVMVMLFGFSVCFNLLMA